MTSECLVRGVLQNVNEVVASLSAAFHFSGLLVYVYPPACNNPRSNVTACGSGAPFISIRPAFNDKSGP